MTSPLHFYLSLNAFSPTFWISCQPLWAPSQCFFGAQMTELGPTFKDNCLIGVFSYAVGSWGPEKGSDNSVIMRLQQIYAFAAELWRMSWQPRALSTSTLPPWTPRYSQNCGASFNTNTRVFARVSVWVCVCIVRTHDCISVYEWDVRVCLNPARLQVCRGKNLCLCFYSCCTATVSYLKGGRTLLHGTSSSFWYSSWIQSVRWSLFV